MKKRLLSAALALAMVLTLLPVSVFAATTTGASPRTPQQAGTYTTGTTTNYFYLVDATHNITQNVSLCTGSNEAGDGRLYGRWYWLDNKTDPQNPVYYEVTTGIVTGTGGSGQWYADVADYSRTVNGNTTVNGAFTVLSGSVNLSTYTNSSLTINFVSDIGNLTIPGTLTSLTLTGKYQNADPSGVMGKGKVGAISIDRSAYVQGGITSGLNLTANNVDIASIDLYGRTNTVKLTDCKVGPITMDGYATTNAQGTQAYNAQTVTADDSTVGAISISNSNGGGVTLNNTLGGQPVNFTSDGGTIRVTGYSNVGMITVTPRTNTGTYAPVTITGGTVGGVTQGVQGTNDKALSVTVSGSTTNFGAITAGVNGTVSITDADGASVTVDKGSLTIGGTGVNISGDVTLAADAATTLKMDATNSTFGGIKSSNGSALTISSWVGKRYRDGGNNYGTLALSSSYDGRQVTGGTFARGNSSDFGNATTVTNWLKLDDLLLYADDGTVIDLYGKTELPRAVSDYGVTLSTASGTFTALGQATGAVNLTLKNGANPWAVIGYNTTTPIILPSQINGMTITKWYGVDNHDIELDAGREVGVPYTASGLTLNATGSANTAVNKITKATTTASASGAPVVNQNVTATLSGNTVNITGAVVPGVGGVATVYVDLETDVVDENGRPIVLGRVPIDCYMKDGRLTKVEFNNLLPETVRHVGAVVINGELVLNMGTGAHYTVTANVNESASRLGIAEESDIGDKIVVTFGGKLASLNQVQKDQYAKQITEGGSFTYGTNQAMQQAINAAQATITSNSNVTSWITNAQNTIWRQGFKSPNQSKNSSNYGYYPNMAPNTGTFNSNTASGRDITRFFDKAYIVPYLVINVTEYDPAGTMTATLTPYYRVDVSANSGYDKDVAYTVQTGKALTLTGNMTATPVKVKLGSALDAKFATKIMHQDGKYAYTGASTEWTITHLGDNGTLGTMVINGNDGLIEIDSAALDAIGPSRVPTLASLACKYDTLQAAIDDTVRGNTVQTVGGSFDPASETMDTIKIDGKYTGTDAITMTGTSRKVKVVANGQQNVTAAGSKVSVNRIGTQSTGGYVYTVELTQDTTTSTGGNITVASATGGTASVSANPASVGSTVTITLSASVGYVPAGVTVYDSSNRAVSVSGSGSTYTFTMPSGNVTVTPSFTQTQTPIQTQTNVVVNNPSTGSGSAITNAGNNQAAPGSTVTVTTVPASGQRTMGLNVTGATAYRTGPNQFQFTVPSGYTNVTVTPVFDVNNNTNFSDVWSNQYYSKPVAWAVSQGITTGTSDYTFGPSESCTRVQMVTFLWRAAGRPSTAGMSNPFSDVTPSMGSDFYNAILWANAKKITQGDGSTTVFNPNKTVTRAEAVTFLYRYENSPAASASNSFRDVSSNAYYAKAVSWANSKGITNGDGSTTYFNTDGACLREHIVTFLYRDITGNKA